MPDRIEPNHLKVMADKSFYYSVQTDPYFLSFFFF